MERFPIPPVHDLVQFPASSAEEMACRYRAWLLGGPAAFSNDPARRAAPLALQREISLDILRRNVRQASRPKGRDANEEVIEAVWRFGGDRRIATYEAPHWHFDFLAGFSARIAADLLMVEDGAASLFWIQARRGAAPNQAQLGMLQRLFLLKSKDSDYEEVGLTLLDLRGVSEGQRVLCTYLIGDLPLPSESQAEAMLQTFADAHAILVEEGFATVRAELRARRRRDPPGQGAMFT